MKYLLIGGAGDGSFIEVNHTVVSRKSEIIFPVVIKNSHKFSQEVYVQECIYFAEDKENPAVFYCLKGLKIRDVLSLLINNYKGKNNNE